MNRPKFRCVLALIGAMLLAGAQLADAAPITNGGAVGTGYTIESIDGGVTMDFTPHMPAGGNLGTIGKLTMTLSHSSLVWLGFTLHQNAAAASDSSVSGGLRVLLDVKDTNGMTLPWIDYHIHAADFADIDVQPPPNESGHLAVAHFHDDNLASGPLVLQGSGNNVTTLNFGLGAPVAPGGLFTATDILVHERDFAGYQREFRIETIPSVVPEPTAFVLAALGMLGLVTCARQRRFRSQI